ncbi:MAG: hypothetical protein JNM47_13600 [Hyphomonadaceae bacterium]|nr:hypothetical protein [Hyphomonadaceae bacterium]
MGKLEKIVADLEALPEGERDRILNVVEGLIEDCARSGSLLTAEQAAEVERRLADPDNMIVPDEEVEAFFSRFRA